MGGGNNGGGFDRADPKRDSLLFKHSEEHGCKETAEHFSVTIYSVKEARRRTLKRRRIVRERMTPERIKAIRGACIKAARNRGQIEHAEDFASWAMIKILEGRKDNTTYLLVDYLRENFGRIGSDSNIAHHSPSLANMDSLEDQKTLPPDSYDRIENYAVGLSLQGREREYFLLHYKHGLALTEIASVSGVSSSRVCQILGAVKDKILKHQEGLK